MIEKYYINWSIHSNNWLVKKQGGEDAGKIIQILQTKADAEKYIRKLEENENRKDKLLRGQ